jgi:hypothetical protein
MARFPGDRVAALAAVVECGECSLQDRNHAVWALGQLEAERALPVLQKYYDGERCTHSTRVCQHELGKAIRMIEARPGRTGLAWNVIRRLRQP